MTASELAERLDSSAAGISGAVRYLQTISIIRRVSQNGSRRDRYELPSDWYASLVRQSPVYGVLAAQADAGIAAVGRPGLSGHGAAARHGGLLPFSAAAAADAARRVGAGARRARRLTPAVRQ